MFKVLRQATPDSETSWYETMLSPFKTFDECLEYIKKYSQYYPNEHCNYQIKFIFGDE